MEYLGDKLNSFTSETVTSINELKRKRKRQTQKKQTIEKQVEASENSQQVVLESAMSARANNSHLPQKSIGIYGFDLDRIKKSPLSGGVPFGGDSIHSATAAPPAIGFKFVDDPSAVANEDASIKDENEKPNRRQQTQAQADDGSSESLYQGDTWSRLWFQRIMILTLLRLMLFIRKVYEDYSAFRIYSVLGQTGHLLISGSTLLLPTLVFTIYRVARYLQIALPSIRTNSPANRILGSDTDPKVAPSSADERDATQHKTSKQTEDAQSRRALMSSPSDSVSQQIGSSAAAAAADEDGLATARQTPTNPNEDEFQDTRSHQDQLAEASVRPDSTGSSAAPSTALVKDSPKEPSIGRQSRGPLKLESVNVDRLGDIPDKQTTRIIIGASEQILHGILFVFWQLKRQVDIVGYLVERSCLWRKPKDSEREQLGRLRFSGDGLEWFQDFYAAFLAILAQVYALSSYWADPGHGNKRTVAPLGASSINSATSGLAGLSPSESPENSVSNSARLIGSVLNQVTILGEPNGGDILITGEIIVSCFVVLSLLVAVRRTDDGPLTFGLSMLGWGSIFAARIIVIALAFVHIGWHLMLPLVLCHILAITIWIYGIAIDSHNGKPGESEEYKWNPVAIEDAPMVQLNNNNQQKPTESNELNSTSAWSVMEHLILIAQVITLFAIPSLFYWPIMFNLKLHARPFKYLALIMSENFILIAAIWYRVSANATSAQWFILGTIGAFSIVGFFFIALYIACKPSLTEYFARADEIINEAERSGIYYEFCSRVFKMPDLTKNSFTRLMNQSEQIEEIDAVTTSVERI